MAIAYGFDEDGTPSDAARAGIELVIDEYGGGGDPDASATMQNTGSSFFYDSGANYQLGSNCKNQIGYTPLPIPFRDVILVGFSTWVGTAASADGLVRMGLYTDAGGRPGDLLVDAGTIATDTTGYKNFIVADLPLDTPGNFWLAVHHTATTGGTVPETSHNNGPHRVGGFVLPYSYGFRQLGNTTVWGGGFGTNASTADPLPASVNPANISWGRWRGYGAIQIKRAGA